MFHVFCFFFFFECHRIKRLIVQMSKRRRLCASDVQVSKERKGEEETSLHDNDNIVDDMDGDDTENESSASKKEAGDGTMSVPPLWIRSNCVSTVGDDVEDIVHFLRRTDQLKYMVRKYMMQSKDTDKLRKYIVSCRQRRFSSSSSSSSPLTMSPLSSSLTHSTDDERVGKSQWCQLPTDVWTDLVLPFLGWHYCCKVLLLVNRHLLDLVQTTPMVLRTHNHTHTHTPP